MPGWQAVDTTGLGHGDAVAKIPNLPAAGRCVAFKLSPQARKDIILLRTILMGATGESKPLSVSEVVKICIRFTATHEGDLRKIAERVALVPGGKK